MAVSKEGVLCRKIMDHIRALGGFAIKLHIDEYGPAGLPDIYACLKGRHVWIEVKDNSPTSKEGRPSMIQYAMMRKLSRAGAESFVARCMEDAQAWIDEYYLLMPSFEINYLTKEMAYFNCGMCKTHNKFLQYNSELLSIPIDNTDGL
jgi:hypothetical protein